MTPEQQQIQELKRQVNELMRFMQSFENAGQVAPNIARTIRLITGGSTLNNLSDVEISSPTNGQVLKYNSSTQTWFNGTDNT